MMFVEVLEQDSMLYSATPDGSSLALVLVWSREEPERIGEVITMPRRARGSSFVIGRTAERGEDGATPLMLSRLRPFERQVTGPFRASRVSRRQLTVKVEDADTLYIENVGRGLIRVNGHQLDKATVRAGDLIEAERRFILLCTHRPNSWPMHAASDDVFVYGLSDEHGMVGESPALWELRERVEFVATRDGHVLIHGPSGSGKELVAHAVHTRSKRRGAEIVSRNAATIPETLVDAELFGNMKNYPNPGMPVRVGLLGEADGSSLFLDEIGELPHAMQAHLLRVLDSGEYQRLGEARPRRSDFRLIAATNRDPAALKHDFLARFTLRVEVPGLGEHREDIVLVARHLLRQIARSDVAMTERFFRGDEPRLSPELVYGLMWHPFTTHVRELNEVLWRALATSPGQYLQPPPGFQVRAPPEPTTSRPYTDPNSLSREEVMTALEECEGVKERAWRELGLRNRFQLNRLLKKFEDLTET